MKIIRQFAVIAVICCLAELLKYLIPLSIPASIYGLILMLGALLTGALKLSQVEDAADALIAAMPVMFIPPAVGLLDCWRQAGAMLVPLLLAVTLGTVLVMGAAGRVTQAIQTRRKEKPNHE